MAADHIQKRRRSCIACGRGASKDELLRIVRTSEGSACFDATGRLPGRGAYVCSDECFHVACKAGKLARALKMKLGQDDYEQIAGDLARALREARD